MPIFKARIQTEYVVLPNKTAQNINLSFEAKGMLALLLSLPEDWAINRNWLIGQSEAGRDKVQRIINELIQRGYINKTQPKNQQGKFGLNNYFVYPEAQCGKAVNGKPVNGESTTTKETVKQSKQKDSVGSSQHSALKEEMFTELWKFWKQKKKELQANDNGSKKDALTHWNKLYNNTYFKNKTEREFRDEVNSIFDTAEQVHMVGPDGYTSAKNQHLVNFLKRESWRN